MCKYVGMIIIVVYFHFIKLKISTKPGTESKIRNNQKRRNRRREKTKNVENHRKPKAPGQKRRKCFNKNA